MSSGKSWEVSESWLGPNIWRNAGALMDHCTRPRGLGSCVTDVLWAHGAQRLAGKPAAGNHCFPDLLKAQTCWQADLKAGFGYPMETTLWTRDVGEGFQRWP